MNSESVEVQLAKALFHVDVQSVDTDSTEEEKKSKWTENKANYIQSARRLHRVLEKLGVTLQAKEPSLHYSPGDR